MDKKIFGFGLALILLSLSFMMFGCKNDSIKFNRESQVGNLLEQISPTKQQKDVTKKSGGMIIIKEQKKNNLFHGDFGPVDIRFDMPEAIK